VALGSFTHGALADLSAEDLDRMLELDETLFVEHKTNIGTDSAHELVRSVAAFANTVGGWLLIGVTNGQPNGKASLWTDRENPPTLVDAVRDRLHHEIDPLPAFEARVVQHRDGPVGVVRVYESSDTPHVVLRSGSVFVREAAGVGDASAPRQSGSGRRRERAYEVAVIRSRAQLLGLSERGREASERVDRLLDPWRPLPLMAAGVGLSFAQVDEHVVQPRYTSERASIVVRLVPYTLAPRFRGWATTTRGAASVVRALEDLADIHGMGPDWAKPDPSGAWSNVGNNVDPRHTNSSGNPLETCYRVVVDGAGVVGAAFELGPPKPRSDDMRPVKLDQLADGYIRPVVKAAAAVLTEGEFLGRARCHIDLVRLGTALKLWDQVQSSGAGWVPVATDLPLPATEEDIASVALRAAYAYGRSAGLRAWDPPLES
jgi:hypothetical protein